MPFQSAASFRGLRANSTLHPIDHVAGVRFEQKFKLRAQTSDALLQSRRLIDGFQAIHLGFDSAEGGANAHVKVARGFKELLPAGEGLATVAGHGKAGKKHAGAFTELLGGGGQVFCALFSAQQSVGIAGQFLKAYVADREAEVA